jgi:hypothetical protein
MDIIIKSIGHQWAVISKFIAIARYHKGIFADAKITANLDFDTCYYNRFIMVGIFIKIMTKIVFLWV